MSYNWPSSDGSNGYVLKTDGSGNLTWQVDNTGGGGGSGLWATSTFGIYPIDSSYDVVIGSNTCLLYTSPSPRDRQKSRMPSSA